MDAQCSCIWRTVNSSVKRTARRSFVSIQFQFQFQFQFKCALLAWQKLYICIAKAIAAGLLTNSAYMY